MNSVIAYKQFSLGEGLAELFAPEIKNLEAFKASVVASAKSFCSTFGYDRCYDKNKYEKDDWSKETGHEKDC